MSKLHGNRAFMNMKSAAAEQMRGRDPFEVARLAGAEYDEGEGAFILSVMGEDTKVCFPSLDIEREMDQWLELSALHYLCNADGAPVLHREMKFADMSGGLARGTKFDQLCEKEMSRVLSDKSEEELSRVFLTLGTLTYSNADLCTVIPVLPRFPVTVKLWFADPEDDMPASVRMMVDGSADHYLSVEDAVTVGTFLMGEIKRLAGA